LIYKINEYHEKPYDGKTIMYGFAGYLLCKVNQQLQTILFYYLPSMSQGR